MEGNNDEASAVDSKWTTIQTRSVKPEEVKDSEWMALTPLDSSQSGKYSSFLFLYKPKTQVSDQDKGDIASSHLDRLLVSLGKALDYFYPLAGRLIKNENDNAARLYCNNEGALWIHKRYDGVVSDLINEDDFKSNEDIAGTSGLQASAQTFDVPALIVQVTEFQCGTISLSASYNHMVADGFSGLHFLKSWAEICRGESISLVPVHNRSLMMPRQSSSVVDGAEVVKSSFSLLSNTVTGNSNSSSRTATPMTNFHYPPCKTLRFSKRRIVELKSEAQKWNQSGNGQLEGRFLSTAECVTAYLWRRLVDLQKLEKHEDSNFVFLVNARSRLKDFPGGYFGNCVVGTWMTTITISEDLLTKPLGHVAMAIHNALRRVDDEYVRNWVDLLGRGVVPFRSITSAKLIMASWQHRFPFYELDFGLGIPAKAIQNVFRTPAFSMGKISAYPCSIPGDIIITIFSSQSALENLCDEL